MNSISHISALAVAVFLFVATLTAEEPQRDERFVPNYITIDDVTLSSPNASPRGVPLTAFSDSADFSAMSKSNDLMISEVIHQAFVEVDEVGTEAAAATSVVVDEATSPESTVQPKPVVFRADHPFLVVIRDNRSGAVLFIGRMHRPEA